MIDRLIPWVILLTSQWPTLLCVRACVYTRASDTVCRLQLYSIVVLCGVWCVCGVWRAVLFGFWWKNLSYINVWSVSRLGETSSLLSILWLQQSTALADRQVMSLELPLLNSSKVGQGYWWIPVPLPQNLWFYCNVETWRVCCRMDAPPSPDNLWN